ncbi:MAG: hypothetical protein Q8R70_05765 [Methanoregula sp.]|nr:hypothetical protein [Methanoregula sp.]
MVRDSAQLYTIEGVAAGLIMILTAFFVVNATTVYTAGDSHISDMQLEILGSDALKMMDTPTNSSVTKSPLQTIIEPVNPDSETFKTLFLNLTNNRNDIGPDRIQFTANISYYNIAAGTTESLPFASSRTLTGGEHAVRATKWVIVDKALPGSVTKPRAVLVEVLMWRD